MLIPEEKISEILHSSDIVDIVSESVILKKSGQNYFGLCPFHSEKTPSFSVNPAKQIFHCFGCGAGGNSLSFVMKYHGLSFPEAAKMLARKYNIVIDTQHLDPARKKQLALKETLFRINQKVMAHYEARLRQAPPGQAARQYLENRGITPATLDEFHLGFSVDQWEDVVGFLKQARISRQAALNSGLVVPRKNQSGFYDRFRNRIMFPIFDINMQVAGFGGRVMDDQMPKYMNSPETPVYSKTRILYGLHAAKTHCRNAKVVHIVEGYFDFLTLFQNGIKNTVATLGTALTAEHVRILKGYAPAMVLVFDSDAAGIHAARRSIKTFLNEGVDTRILILPTGDDPDAFVLKHGPDAFLDLAARARSVMPFLRQVAMDTHGSSVAGRARVLADLMPYIADIQDSALRSLHVNELAETLNIDEAAVLEKVREQVIKSKTTLDRHPDMELSDPELASDPRERQLLSLMLQWPQIISDVVKSGVLDHFYSQQLCRIGRIMVQADPAPDAFVTRIMTRMETDADRELIASLAMTDGMDDNTDLKDAAAAIIQRIIRIRKKKDSGLTEKIKRAEKGCDTDLMELLKLKQQEIRQLHNGQ
ncbi:DNA primase [Desulfotignum phosphitoxidans]|uniref:DNA primase n=1 Tax=Desulfotignum phosphitoxidans DSM 13687 TaxID=1286635 RepID=S0G4I3_9BACT|nr:DNA primase [Desulfotignum phosphitoxidans]EMS79247.1 DNA primase DnaG [Desulfotignum phosphitoxidans DSM 13687]